MRNRQNYPPRLVTLQSDAGRIERSYKTLRTRIHDSTTGTEQTGTANCFEQSVRAAESLSLRVRLLVRLDRVAGRIVNANLRHCDSRIFLVLDNVFRSSICSYEHYENKFSTFMGT